MNNNGFARLFVAAKNTLQYFNEVADLNSLDAVELLRAAKTRRERQEAVIAELKAALNASHDIAPDEDWFEEIISDTMDMDWHPRYAAKAIVRDWSERWYPDAIAVAETKNRV